MLRANFRLNTSDDVSAGRVPQELVLIEREHDAYHVKEFAAVNGQDPDHAIVEIGPLTPREELNTTP